MFHYTVYCFTIGLNLETGILAVAPLGVPFRRGGNHSIHFLRVVHVFKIWFLPRFLHSCGR